MLFRFLFIEAVKTYQKLFAWANVSVGSYVGCVLALNSVGTLASGEETLKGGGVLSWRFDQNPMIILHPTNLL